MKRPNSIAKGLNAPRAATLFAVTVLFSGATAAQAPADNWQFRAMLYGYFPSVGGSTTFSTGGSGIGVSTDKFLDDLNGAFMASLEVQKGRWGAFTDFAYVDVGGLKSGTRDLTVGGVQLPVGVSANASLDIKASVWTVAGNYRVLATPEGTFDVFAGARLLSYKQDLGWEFSANVGSAGTGRTGKSNVDVDNWDGIVGAKGRWSFGQNRQWFVPYYVDIGAGDSDLTWQVFGGIGYAFSWGEILGGYRYLDYQFKSGTKIESMNLSGPAVGIAFRW